MKKIAGIWLTVTSCIVFASAAPSYVQEIQLDEYIQNILQDHRQKEKDKYTKVSGPPPPAKAPCVGGIYSDVEKMWECPDNPPPPLPKKYFEIVGMSPPHNPPCKKGVWDYGTKMWRCPVESLSAQKWKVEQESQLDEYIRKFFQDHHHSEKKKHKVSGPPPPAKAPCEGGVYVTVEKMWECPNQPPPPPPKTHYEMVGMPPPQGPPCQGGEWEYGKRKWKCPVVGLSQQPKEKKAEQDGLSLPPPKVYEKLPKGCVWDQMQNEYVCTSIPSGPLPGKDVPNYLKLKMQDELLHDNFEDLKQDFKLIQDMTSKDELSRDALDKRRILSDVISDDFALLYMQKHKP